MNSILKSRLVPSSTQTGIINKKRLELQPDSTSAMLHNSINYKIMAA